MSLLEQIREEQARLETMRRQRGIVTAKMIRESLPASLDRVVTPQQCAVIAEFINREFEAAERTPLMRVPRPTTDHQQRATGETA